MSTERSIFFPAAALLLACAALAAGGCEREDMHNQARHEWLEGSDFFADESDPVARENRLCEINVAAQVANVCHTSIVQDAWRRGQPLAVHGWIYDLADGLLRDLDLVVERAGEIAEIYRVERSSRGATDPKR